MTTHRRRMEGAADYLKREDKREQLDRDERQYKREGAARTREGLETFLRGETEHADVQQQPLNLLDWRTRDDLNAVVAANPDLFRQALTRLWSDQAKFSEADAFWGMLDPSLAALSETSRKRFASLNARTSVASYFLFIAAPERHPFYRASFSARAIQALYDKAEGLDKSSVGGLLRDFVGRCHYVQREWPAAGVPLEDMADVQSALYILAQEYFWGQGLTVQEKSACDPRRRSAVIRCQPLALTADRAPGPPSAPGPLPAP
ncbi:hypothetical protein [Deinococcus frigens]|uniref:hypothetical protein n=1 Tax=Deinococcus frigens TaxID=249403 RepID=UPI00049811E1|nr:hypothetical protein [Deinococcus frigens]